MSRANEKKRARRKARQAKGAQQQITPEMERELIASIQQNIWHGKRPPASAEDALRTPLDYPVPEHEIRTFVAFDEMLADRGWEFVDECSGPDVLTWLYGPSDAGPTFLDKGLEPVTALAATLDRSSPTDTVGDCEVEVFLVGDREGQCRLAGLSAVNAHLDTIEAHRPGTPILVPFPIGRARRE